MFIKSYLQNVKVLIYYYYMYVNYKKSNYQMKSKYLLIYLL